MTESPAAVPRVAEDAKPAAPFAVRDVVEDLRFPNHAGRLPLGRVFRVDEPRREADVHFEEDAFASLGVHWSYLQLAPPERARTFALLQQHHDTAPTTIGARRREAKLR